MLAALIWLLGAIACGDLGMKLLVPPSDPTPLSQEDLYTSIGTAIVVGILLGATFFRRLANENCDRINNLHEPKCWECYRIRFYIFLVVFDGGSVLVSDYFAKDTLSRLIIGTIDLTICVALSVSFIVYPYKSFTVDSSQTLTLDSPLLLDDENDEIITKSTVNKNLQNTLNSV